MRKWLTIALSFISLFAFAGEHGKGIDMGLILFLFVGGIVYFISCFLTLIRLIQKLVGKRVLKPKDWVFTLITLIGSILLLYKQAPYYIKQYQIWDRLDGGWEYVILSTSIGYYSHNVRNTNQTKA